MGAVITLEPLYSRPEHFFAAAYTKGGPSAPPREELAIKLALPNLSSDDLDELAGALARPGAGGAAHDRQGEHEGRALPGDHIGVIERRDQHRAAAAAVPHAGGGALLRSSVFPRTFA